MWKALLLVLALAVSISANRDDSVIKLMLDQMEILMTGNTEFDPVFYKKLIAGMDD